MSGQSADTLIEPNIIHVDEAEWSDEVERDRYVEQLMDVFDSLERCPGCRVIWSDESEELLWDSETTPAWMTIPAWRNQLLPILTRRLHARRTSLGSVSELDTAEMTPLPTAELKNRPEWIVFRKLAHAVSVLELECVVYGVPQEHHSVDIACRCECHGTILHPLVSNLPALLRCTPIADLLWPDGSDFDSLGVLLDLWRVAHFEGIEFKYKAQFSRAYVKKLVALCGSERLSVVDAMVRRLVMSESEAGRDKSLNEETVNGGEHRIRVSRSRRIHYIYPSSGSLLFTDYYGEGEHDRGL